MDKLTIKLLNERKASSVRRKIDGRSGTVYTFLWDPAQKAYCYEGTAEEVEDLFLSQGRMFGSYFAPVFAPKPAPKPLSDHITLSLLKNEIEMPKGTEQEDIAAALVATFERGVERGAELERARSTSRQHEPIACAGPKTSPVEEALTEPAGAPPAVNPPPTAPATELKPRRQSQRTAKTAA